MGWISWVAGLAFFDIIMILLVMGAGSSGVDIGVDDYDGSSGYYDANYNVSTTDALTGDGLSWFQQFKNGFSIMPWWVNLFMITFNAVLIIILILSLIRGFS